MDIWFICENEDVRGPFTANELKAMVTDGQIGESTLVWGRPQQTWMPANRWASMLPQLMSHKISESSSQQQLWHYAVNGTSVGPLTRAELVNELKAATQKNQILVWTKGMKAWGDLFEFHDLLEEIGLNRRESPRLSIQGAAIIRFEDKTLLGQLQTISPGGVGITKLDSRLPIGQLVSIEIKSEVLGEPVHMKALVQYSTESGFYGFKAQSLSIEAKSRIIACIKRKQSEVARAA